MKLIHWAWFALVAQLIIRATLGYVEWGDAVLTMLFMMAIFLLEIWVWLERAVEALERK